MTNGHENEVHCPNKNQVGLFALTGSSIYIKSDTDLVKEWQRL